MEDITTKAGMIYVQLFTTGNHTVLQYTAQLRNRKLFERKCGNVLIWRFGDLEI